MTRPRTPRPDAAGAGFLLLTVVLVFGVTGGVIGAAVDGFALSLIAGIFVGSIVGTWVVYRRFRDL